MPQILLLVVFSLLLIPGIFMAFLPLPGLVYMLAIAVGFAFLEGFARISGADIAILSVIAAVTLLVDLVSGIMGAKWGGASWASILWGLVGLVLGSVCIPIPIFGSLIGMFIAILASEWFRTRDVRKANSAALGSFLGWLAGTGFKIAAAIVFIVLFVILAVV